MHAHGIEILDRTDDDDVVLPVADHFEFVLFPAQERLFDQAVAGRREEECAFQLREKLFFRVSRSAAFAA